MEQTKKLTWWKKGLYVIGLIIGLLLGGAERAGYLLHNSPIFVVIIFYIILISAIGFFWEQLKGNSDKKEG